MKILYPFFIFLSFSTFSFAQILTTKKNYIDSLNQILKVETNDSLKARAAFLLSDYWVFRDRIKAQKYLNQSKKLIKNNEYLLGIYNYQQAHHYMDKNPNEAVKWFKKSLKLLRKFRTKDSYYYQSSIWANLAILDEREDDITAALDKYLHKAIPLAEKANTYFLLASHQTNAASILSAIGMRKEATSYFLNSLAYYEGKTIRSDRVLITCIFAAQNYILDYKNEAAKTLIDRAEVILKDFPDSDYNIEFNDLQANYYLANDQLDSALIAINKGLALSEKMQFDPFVPSLYKHLYHYYMRVNKYNDALKALEIAMDSQLYPNLSELGNNSELMSVVYKKLNNDRLAYQWAKKSLALKDSLYNLNLYKEISNLEGEFRFNEKEKEILKLQSEKFESELKAKNQRLLNWLLGFGGAVLFLALLVVANFYKTNKQHNAHKLREIEQQKELQIAQAIMEGEERERQRLGRDLHDGLGGALSGIKIKLSSQQKNISSPVLDESILQLENSIKELRSISRNMMPETLLRSGLETAIRDLCVSFTNDSVDIEFQSNEIQNDMQIVSQVNIYRIIQELLTNAIKHAQCNKIIVQCIQNQDKFLITVEDNGKGFSYQNLEKSKGIGLNNVQNRVNYMKGSFTVDSHQGTTINIELYV
jgi:two-component system NarL family sensor kinase